MTEMTKDERLALLTALEKRIGPALKDAKSEACSELMERCEADGTDRRAVRVGGAKVGEVGVSYAKERFSIVNMTEALACLREMGLTVETPKVGWESAFACIGGEVVCKETGEACPWAIWEPSRPRGASVRIKEPQAVLDAFGARLDGMSPLALLGEGE